MKTTKMSAIPRLRSGWRACRAILVLALGLMVCSTQISQAAPMGTAFTYQGRLLDANSAADGPYDLQFRLYDGPSDGNQLGSTIDIDELDVIDGYFTVALDFGAGIFDGDARWLEIGVRPGDSSDPKAFVKMSPRQEVTPTPYALAVRVPLTLQGAIEGGSLITADNSIFGITGGFEAAHANDVLSFGVKGSAVNTTLGDTDPYDPDNADNFTYGGYFTAEASPGPACGEIGPCGYGIGVYGKASGGDYTYGGYFQGAGTWGNGVYGQASGVYGTGVYGQATEDYSTGVYGLASASSGTNYGVYGETNSSSGYAGYFVGGRNYFSGNVGIGTWDTGGYKLYVQGTAYSTGGWQSSDLRFKENIKKIDSPIDKIRNIVGVSFEWKISEYKDKGFPEGRHYGVVAQQVEEILPEIVKEGPDGDKAVSYTELVPILTEAIKQQQKQIESLQYEVAQLKDLVKKVVEWK